MNASGEEQMPRTPVAERPSTANHRSELDAEFGGTTGEELIAELRRHASRDWNAVVVAANTYLDARGVHDGATRLHLIREAAMAATAHPTVCDGPALAARVLALIDRLLASRRSEPAVAAPEAVPAPSAAPTSTANAALAHCPAVYGRRPMRPQRLEYPQVVPPMLRAAVTRLMTALNASPAPAKRS